MQIFSFHRMPSQFCVVTQSLWKNSQTKKNVVVSGKVFADFSHLTKVSLYMPVQYHTNNALLKKVSRASLSWCLTILVEFLKFHEGSLDSPDAFSLFFFSKCTCWGSRKLTCSVVARFSVFFSRPLGRRHSYRLASKGLEWEERNATAFRRGKGRLAVWKKQRIWQQMRGKPWRSF